MRLMLEVGAVSEHWNRSVHRRVAQKYVPRLGELVAGIHRNPNISDNADEYRCVVCRSELECHDRYRLG
jgi:hypothetical protein